VTNYAEWYGMFLNIDRIEQRASMRTAADLMAALGGEIDAAWFEAVCDTEEEAQEAAYEHHMARRMAEARAKFTR
jgi:hypothetical protein